jgi:two-component sensor histidine kinase
MSALPTPTLRRLPAAAALTACGALGAALLVGAGGTPIPTIVLGAVAALLLLAETGRRAFAMLRSGFGVPLVLAILGVAVAGAAWSIVVAFHAEFLAIFGLLLLVGLGLIARPLLEARGRMAAGATPWQALTRLGGGKRQLTGGVLLREHGSLLLGVFFVLLAARVATGTRYASSSGIFGVDGSAVVLGLMGMVAAAAAGWFASAARSARLGLPGGPISAGGARGVAPGPLAGGSGARVGGVGFPVAGALPATTTARDEQVVAAHLHDSVLQTLALIQRSTSDPARVGQLARQQERSLRQWLAGRDDTSATTLQGALRAAAQDVEDEEPGAVIEVVIVGGAPLDAPADAMVRAAREAMRNAVRHAGSPVRVFLEVEDARRELFVRDTGSGFDLSTVDDARRGVRDSIIGRMEHVGGTATIDSGPSGTDVILRFDPSEGATLAGDPFGGVA